MGVEDRRGKANRKVVLIDLEDMLFGEQDGHDLARSEDRSAEILDLSQARRPTDRIVVGCSAHLVFLANSLFPSAQVVSTQGADGSSLALIEALDLHSACLLYTSPSPRDQRGSRMPSSA